MLLLLGWTAGQVARPVATETISFKDVTRQAGIDFVHHSSSDKRYIVESMGGGVALWDYDGDGWLDIYLLNSNTVDGVLANRPSPSAGLYRNKKNGTFEEVAARAGLANPGWAMGVSVADYDDNGHDDLYVTCFGPNRLYRNRGDGTFEDVTTKAGVGDPRFSTGSAWGDYDRDGDLDLFVANYVAFDLNRLPLFGQGPRCQYRGVPVQCGPRGLEGSGDTLYRNNGDGTFTDVSVAAGVDDRIGYYGLGVVWTDLDNDGWLDLFVANDVTPNYAYRNQRDGTFSEQGLALGLAVSEDGVEQASMGVSVGDYDRDGLLDLIVTNFSDEYNTLYRRSPDGSFTDVSRKTRTAEASIPYVGWGVRFSDLDNDGWLDLFVANGHVYPQIEGAYPGGHYRQRKLLYRNLGDGTFSETAAMAGEALMHPRASRGAAFGDIDHDGDIDIVVNNLDGPAQLLRNEAGSKIRHWIELSLVGTKSNRNAIGARVELTASGRKQVDEVRAGDSYLSSSDRRLHFGLAGATSVDRVIVRWPSVVVEEWKGLKCDGIAKLVEGKGTKVN
ncbi:MAG: CRTAC1 family protein [Acidobacteriota bacterium]